MLLKRITLFLLSILILIFALAMPAMATTTTYHLDELKMDVDIPDEGYVYTRDIKLDDPELEFFDMTHAEMLTYFEELGIYLEYVNLDPYYEIDIMMAYENEEIEGYGEDDFGIYYNLNLYSDIQVNKIAGANIDLFKDDHLHNYQLYTVDQDNSDQQIKFIGFDGWYDAGESIVNTYEYGTIYNGQSIYLVLYNFDSTIDDDMKAKLKGIVDSIEFSETLEAPEKTTPEETTPEAWTKESINEVFDIAAGLDWENIILPIFITVGALMIITIIIVIVLIARKNRKANKAYYDENINSVQSDTQADDVGKSTADTNTTDTNTTDTNTTDTNFDYKD